MLPLLAAHLGSALPPPPLPLAGPFKSQSLFAHPCRLANLAVTNLAVTNPIATLAVTNLTATSLNVTGGARVGGTLTADIIVARLITATQALASKGTLAVTRLTSLPGGVSAGASTLSSLIVSGITLEHAELQEHAGLCICCLRLLVACFGDLSTGLPPARHTTPPTSHHVQVNGATTLGATLTSGVRSLTVANGQAVSQQAEGQLVQALLSCSKGMALQLHSLTCRCLAASPAAAMR